MLPAAVLFDLDGTLVNSFPGIMHCANQALRDHGFDELSEETLRTFVGPPLVHSFARWGVPDDQVASVVNTYRHHYEEVGLTDYVLYDGIVETVQALSQAGIPLAVATLKPRRFALELIAHAGLDSYFHFVAGTKSDHSDETKADIIRIALAELDLTASPDVVMIGDREQDALGAHEVGTDFIGAEWGFGSRAEFLAAHATTIVAEPRQVLPLLLS